jgi:hypothetical protein
VTEVKLLIEKIGTVYCVTAMDEVGHIASAKSSHKSNAVGMAKRRAETAVNGRITWKEVDMTGDGHALQ